MIPSKELLSEVLKKDYNHIERYADTICCRNMINGELQDGWDINIYELAHKCKEWALSKGYVIFSSVQLNGWAVFIQTDEDGIIVSFEGKEPEAIFKACEWVMERTK